MAIHVLVVSHNHGNLISQIGALEKLARNDNVNVYVKNNHPDPALIKYATRHHITIINDDHGLGFGANNNYLFNRLSEKGVITEYDHIVILNPDVDVSNQTLLSLVNAMRENNDELATINLFRDYALNIHDNSIRKWPRFADFFSSCIGARNNTIINKEIIKKPACVDWAAGSFLVFTSSLYRKLGGFDERYFMYCEDVDICFRARQIGVKVKYYPDLYAVHLAAHASRKFFTKHFFWHIKSALRFLLSSPHKSLS